MMISNSKWSRLNLSFGFKLKFEWFIPMPSVSQFYNVLVWNWNSLISKMKWSAQRSYRSYMISSEKKNDTSSLMSSQVSLKKLHIENLNSIRLVKYDVRWDWEESFEFENLFKRFEIYITITLCFQKYRLFEKKK